MVLSGVGDGVGMWLGKWVGEGVEWGMNGVGLSWLVRMMWGACRESGWMGGVRGRRGA